MAIEERFNISLIAALALREKQIQQNYRPIIAVHKWFARRPGSLFRGLVGDVLESAIEGVLAGAGIRFRKTKRAERIQDFDQTPDFIVRSEFNPQVVIEAKIIKDDGTARDKVTRVQHLGALSMEGRGREDMKKLLLATRGKVFTLQNVEHLIPCTRLAEIRTK
jgi:hypothetical protein